MRVDRGCVWSDGWRNMERKERRKEEEKKKKEEKKKEWSNQKSEE